MRNKVLVLLALVGVVAVFFLSGAHEQVSFANLKAQQENFQSYYEQNQFLTVFLYLLIYVLVTALSLPGATILTLAGGAMFGLGFGTVLVSLASTTGATLAFLLARYLFRDAISARFGDKLRKIDAGMERDGAFYLFSLRLIPIFPFFVINAVMGLTAIPLVQFFFVSQVGMLPGTLVYVNAGTQLSQLESAAGILSLDVLFSFALLGLFPLIAKKLMALIQSKRSSNS